MNTSRQRRRGGKRTISSPLHPPLPRPDPRALAPLHLRLRAFGVAPTPDPDESWHQLRPLLLTHTVTPLQRLRRRGIRGGAAAAAALMVLVTSVALAAEPVQRLVVGSAVSAWEGLMDLAGAASDDDSITRGQARGGLDRGEEASPAGGEGDGGTSDGSGSSGPGKDVAADAPLVVRSDQTSVAEDTTATISVLENDGRFGGGVKLQTSQPAHGTASANNRTITYTPPADFNGSDSFSYWVSDGETSARAEVTVAVTPVNDSPRAGNDKRSVDEDDSLVLDLLTNDGDVDSDELRIIKTADPVHGRLEEKDGRLTYEPLPDFNGEDAFSYQVSDGKGGSAVAKVAIKVRPVNDDPEAVDDEATMQAGDSLLFEVLPNDKDVDNDPLSVVEATANHGKVDINPNGSLSYTPDPQFIGDDVISYTVSDGAGGTARAKVMIRVVPPPGEAETGSGAEGSAGGSSSGG